jgi:hypothetical protein
VQRAHGARDSPRRCCAGCAVLIVTHSSMLPKTNGLASACTRTAPHARRHTTWKVWNVTPVWRHAKSKRLVAPGDAGEAGEGDAAWALHSRRALSCCWHRLGCAAVVCRGQPVGSLSPRTHSRPPHAAAPRPQCAPPPRLRLDTRRPTPTRPTERIISGVIRLFEARTSTEHREVRRASVAVEGASPDAHWPCTMPARHTTREAPLTR